MAESPVNGVGTTLASSVTNSATTVSLTSATGFTNAQYHCLISDGTNYEIVLATALSGTTLTVTRAVEAYNGVTTAYSFASGSTINVVPTVASVVGLIEGQPYLSVTGVGNATSATRYVGGTANGAPTSGTFAVGDFIIDQTGTIWVCTTAGTPGTWTTTISSHLSLRSASATVGRNEITLFSGSTASQTLTAPSNPIDGSNWTVINKASVAVTLSFTPSMIALGSSSGVTTFSVPVNGSFSFANYNGSQWYMVASNSATQLIGTLPVANGGTGTTTSTGSGSVVLSGSPAITSPTIGNSGGPYPGQVTFSVGAAGGGGSVQISAPTTQSTNTILNFPVVTTTPDTLATLAATQTLTNKTISGASNTLSNVSLTTAVTGTLPISNGGTGLSSAGTSGGVLTTNGTSFSLATPTATLSPALNGLKAWTMDPVSVTANVITISGNAYFIAVYLQAGVTYSTVYWRVPTGGASGSTMTWGIYNTTTQLAVTSATSVSTSGQLSANFTSAYTPTTSGVYWLGFFASSSGTYPTLTTSNAGVATYNFGPNSTGVLNTLSMRASLIGSLASLPTTIAGTPTTTNANLWVAGLS